MSLCIQRCYICHYIYKVTKYVNHQWFITLYRLLYAASRDKMFNAFFCLCYFLDSLFVYIQYSNCPSDIKLYSFILATMYFSLFSLLLREYSYTGSLQRKWRWIPKAKMSSQSHTVCTVYANKTICEMISQDNSAFPSYVMQANQGSF